MKARHVVFPKPHRMRKGPAPGSPQLPPLSIERLGDAFCRSKAPLARCYAAEFHRTKSRARGAPLQIDRRSPDSVCEGPAPERRRLIKMKGDVASMNRHKGKTLLFGTKTVQAMYLHSIAKLPSESRQFTDSNKGKLAIATLLFSEGWYHLVPPRFRPAVLGCANRKYRASAGSNLEVPAPLTC